MHEDAKAGGRRRLEHPAPRVAAKAPVRPGPLRCFGDLYLVHRHPKPARRIDTHARFHLLLRHRFGRLHIGLRGRRLDACEDGKEK